MKNADSVSRGFDVSSNYVFSKYIVQLCSISYLGSIVI